MNEFIKNLIAGCKYSETHTMAAWYSWPVTINNRGFGQITNFQISHNQCYAFIFWDDNGENKKLVKYADGKWRNWNGKFEQGWA